MRKNSLKSFFLILLSVFTLSCSLQSISEGNVSLILPSRANGDDNSLSLNVELVKGKNVAYSEITSKRDLLIENIPIGHYLLKISGQDSTYRYYGEEEVDVVAGETVDADVEVEKEKIEEEVPPEPDPEPAPVQKTAAKFTELKTALGELSSENPNMEITLTGDIVMDPDGIVIGSKDSAQQNCITGNYNVTIKANTSITIKRGGSYNGALFTVGKGCSLNISGTSSSTITLDGTCNGGSSQLIRSFGNLELNNCSLQKNTNNNSSGQNSIYGGAIYVGCEDTSKQISYDSPLKFTMNSCFVTDIKNSLRGAVYLYCNSNYKINASISDCIISNNNVEQGAIMFENGDSNNVATMNISGTSIETNKATSAGGGINLNRIALTLSGGTISGNETDSNGGGINIGGAISSVTLTNGVIIKGNKAKLNGGGINLNAGAKLIINNGTIYGDDSTQSNNNIVNSANNSIYVVSNTATSAITTNKGKKEYSKNTSYATTITQDTNMSSAN